MNNGILLVEYIELWHRVGVVHRLAAVLEVTLLRVRPILVTFFTTVVGMLPLALNPAEGPQLMRPLALAVIGGLTLPTALSLSGVPVFYLVLTPWRVAWAECVLWRQLRAKRCKNL